MSPAARSLVAGGASLLSLAVYVAVLSAQGNSLLRAGTVWVALATVLALASAREHGSLRLLLLGCATAVLVAWAVLGLFSVGPLFALAAGACVWAMLGSRPQGPG